MKNNSDNLRNNLEGTKKVPSTVLRKCCACGKIVDRNNLIRIMKDNKTGEIIINPSNKQFGRSSYLCKDKDCLKLAIKKKRFKTYSQEIIEKISNCI